MKVFLLLLIPISMAKLVLKGSSIYEEQGIPDEMEKIQEMAAVADKKFHEASQRIVKRVEKRRKALGLKSFVNLELNESDEYED